VHEVGAATRRFGAACGISGFGKRTGMEQQAGIAGMRGYDAVVIVVIMDDYIS
jgi:hypothetical protein